jgi:tetratricopeptide (TPR) repeat protein
MCKPDKVKEAIEYFKKAYEIFPDIVALNQIALAYEFIGEKSVALDYFRRMKAQAEVDNNAAYSQAAELGISRCK